MQVIIVQITSPGHLKNVITVRQAITGKILILRIKTFKIYTKKGCIL